LLSYTGSELCAATIVLAPRGYAGSLPVRTAPRGLHLERGHVARVLFVDGFRTAIMGCGYSLTRTRVFESNPRGIDDGIRAEVVFGCSVFVIVLTGARVDASMQSGKS
jgi:hypothetical protein